jgi:hypothetical protein
MGAVMLSSAEAWEQVMDSTVEAIITTSTTVASLEGNNFPSKIGDGTPLFRYRSLRLQEREERKLTSLTTSSPRKIKFPSISTWMLRIIRRLMVAAAAVLAAAVLAVQQSQAI